MMSSPCGIFDCGTCEKREAVNCPGCLAGNDYLERRGYASCAIYECIRQHGISTCADCAEEDCHHYHGADATCFMAGAISGKRWSAGGPLKDTGANYLSPEERRHIPDRTVARLRWYLRVLEDMSRRGVRSVSSREIAAKAGVNAALIRKDLSYFGEFGTPSFGYDVKYLLKKITEILNLDEQKNIVWIGSQSLEEHVAIMRDLAQQNCHVVAVVDLDEDKIGVRVKDLQVLHISSLPLIVANLDVDVAILALPPEHAQEVLGSIVAAGIKAVLNFTPAILDVPEGVNVRNFDISGELVALSFYCQRGS